MANSLNSATDKLQSENTESREFNSRKEYLAYKEQERKEKAAAQRTFTPYQPEEEDKPKRERVTEAREKKNSDVSDKKLGEISESLKTITSILKGLSTNSEMHLRNIISKLAKPSKENAEPKANDLTNRDRLDRAKMLAEYYAVRNAQRNKRPAYLRQYTPRTKLVSRNITKEGQGETSKLVGYLTTALLGKGAGSLTANITAGLIGGIKGLIGGVGSALIGGTKSITSKIIPHKFNRVGSTSDHRYRLLQIRHYENSARWQVDVLKALRGIRPAGNDTAPTPAPPTEKSSMAPLLLIVGGIAAAIAAFKLDIPKLLLTAGKEKVKEEFNEFKHKVQETIVPGADPSKSVPEILSYDLKLGAYNAQEKAKDVIKAKIKETGIPDAYNKYQERSKVRKAQVAEFKKKIFTTTKDIVTAVPKAYERIKNDAIAKNKMPSYKGGDLELGTGLFGIEDKLNKLKPASPGLLPMTKVLEEVQSHKETIQDIKEKKLTPPIIQDNSTTNTSTPNTLNSSAGRLSARNTDSTKEFLSKLTLSGTIQGQGFIIN